MRLPPARGKWPDGRRLEGRWGRSASLESSHFPHCRPAEFILGPTIGRTRGALATFPPCRGKPSSRLDRAEGPGEDRFLGVDAVLGLIPDQALRAIDPLVR